MSLGKLGPGMLDVLEKPSIRQLHITWRHGFHGFHFHGVSWRFMLFHGAWNRWKTKAALRDELPSDSASGDEDGTPGKQDQAVPQHPLRTCHTLHTHAAKVSGDGWKWLECLANCLKPKTEKVARASQGYITRAAQGARLLFAPQYTEMVSLTILWHLSVCETPNAETCQN